MYSSPCLKCSKLKNMWRCVPFCCAGGSGGIREDQQLHGLLHVLRRPRLPHRASFGRWADYVMPNVLTYFSRCVTSVTCTPMRCKCTELEYDNTTIRPTRCTKVKVKKSVHVFLFFCFFGGVGDGGGGQRVFMGPPRLPRRAPMRACLSVCLCSLRTGTTQTHWRKTLYSRCLPPLAHTEVLRLLWRKWVLVSDFTLPKSQLSSTFYNNKWVMADCLRPKELFLICDVFFIEVGGFFSLSY